MRYKTVIGLLVLIFFASFLRIVVFSSYPSGTPSSNALLDWRVENLFSYGKDEFGRSYPFIFSNWQNFEFPALTYVMLFFRLLDPNLMYHNGIIASLIGTLFITGLFFFVRNYFKNTRLAFYTLVIASISPVLIIFSRFPNAEILALTFSIWGFYFFVKKRVVLGLVLVILGGITSRDLLLFSFFLPFISWVLVRNKLVLLLQLLVFCAFAILFIITSGAIQSIKDHDLSLFFNNTYLDNLNLLRGHILTLHLPAFLGLLLFNKAQLVIVVFKHFFETLSIPFLFSNRLVDYRQTVYNFGPLFIVWVPICLVGIYHLIKAKTNSVAFCILLLFTATIPTLFIAGSFELSRSLWVIVPMFIFIAYGIDQLTKKWQMIFWIGSAVSLILFIHHTLFIPNNEFNPSTAVLAETIQYKIRNKNLTYLPTKDPIKTIWITDSIDPNPGPVLATKLHIPYTDSNLNTGVLSYKGWINQLGGISIGNADQLKKNPQLFDVVVISKVEKEWFNCPSELFTIGEGDQTYYIYERCTQKP